MRKGEDLDVARAVDLMVRRALELGRPLPPDVARAIDLSARHADPGAAPITAHERVQLLHHYNGLAKLVAPATPATLHALERDKPRVLRCLGGVAFVRRMLVIAILCLAAFIGVSASGSVHFDAPVAGAAKATGGLLFGTRSGGTILVDLIFLLLAAALGASFAQLMEATRYARQRAFDPIYEPGYWATFVLGLLGGLMLSTLIPIGDGNLYAKPLLALLGGFSARAVYQVLSRLVDAVVSVVSGDARAMVTAQEEALKARLDQGVAEVHLQTARRLVQARQQLNDPVAARVIDGLVDDLMRRIGGGAGEPLPANPAPAAPAPTDAAPIATDAAPTDAAPTDAAPAPTDAAPTDAAPAAPTTPGATQ